MKKNIKIGFDLDGVIIDKPLLVPKNWIEWLYRSHEGKKLKYRCPGRIEKLIRIISHHPLLRLPIKKNLKVINKIVASNKYELFVVSGRFSFLEKRTKQWFATYNIGIDFSKICLNKGDEQPHEFKKRILRELDLDFFVEDCLDIVKYLSANTNTKILWVNKVLDCKNSTTQNYTNLVKCIQK